jgi:hypothetical protein
MSRRLAAVLLFVATFAAAPAALADGPMGMAQQGGTGVLSADGGTRFVAIGTSSQQYDTTLELVDTSDGTIQRFVDFAGSWGIPTVTAYSAQAGGLSQDGKTIVLGDAVATLPRTMSGFLVVSTTTLAVRRSIWLKGDFAYDALSPDAKRLYLIQHVDANDQSKYVVRGYDLVHGRLLPGRIADRTQRSWVMQGYSTSRVTSANGRWVYTLYDNPGGFPFVHALDTVRGVAHCIGLPWFGSETGVYNLRLELRNGDRTLAVHWLSGRPWLAVSTSTWRMSPDRRGFPWLRVAVGGVAGAGILGAGALLLLRRRGRRQEFQEELGDLLGRAEREVMV